MFYIFASPWHWEIYQAYVKRVNVYLQHLHFVNEIKLCDAQFINNLLLAYIRVRVRVTVIKCLNVANSSFKSNNINEDPYLTGDYIISTSSQIMAIDSCILHFEQR